MVFQVENISKSFGEKKVLDNVCFSVKSGQALGLLGRNGAGKTTSIRIIMGVFPPDSGRVLLDGTHFHRNEIKIGYLPEEHGLYPKKKINEQLEYLGVLRGMDKSAAKKAITHWMERLSIAEYTTRKLDTLSKGNQQKIQLVAALLTNPDLLILDEPFSGLDPVNASLLKDVVREQIEAGKTVIFSSHQMNHVEEFCDNIAILEQGNIVLSGAVGEIKRSYDRRKIDIISLQKQEIEKYCNEKLTDLVAATQLQKEILQVEVQDAGQKSALMQALVGAGFDIDSIAVHEPSLNDIFVEYTAGNSEKKEGSAV